MAAIGFTTLLSLDTSGRTPQDSTSMPTHSLARPPIHALLIIPLRSIVVVMGRRLFKKHAAAHVFFSRIGAF